VTTDACNVSEEFAEKLEKLTGTSSYRQSLKIVQAWYSRPSTLTETDINRMLELLASVIDVELSRPEGESYDDGVENERFTEAHHAYMLTMGFGLDGTSDHGLFYRKANSPDEMVAILSITVPNAYTHGMTIEFSPGTSEVVHIDLQPLPEILIPEQDETLIPADAEV
jgi:hypothetical protein